MGSLGSFAWGFFTGLFVGQVALLFVLAIVRKNNTDEIVGYSPPLAADHETFAPTTSKSEASARLA
jgi:hypothetical protein